MKTASNALGKRSQSRRADWLVGVLVILAVFVLYSSTDFFGTFECRFYDYASTTTSRVTSERIAIIAIDDQSIANIGRWPWPRDIQANLVDQLAAAKAKTIANTTLFFEPQTDRGMVYIRKMKNLLADPALTPSASSDQLGKIITDADVALDTDAKLVASMTKAANVLVPSIFTTGSPQGRPDIPLSGYALKSAVEGGDVEKPMLGRYQVEKELGKDPIRIVYFEKDAKIDRVVAIKTMALSQEFEGKDLADVSKTGLVLGTPSFMSPEQTAVNDFHGTELKI